MLYFDAHLDLAWNGVDWNRDLKLEVAAIREREKALNLKGKARGANTVSYPALRRLVRYVVRNGIFSLDATWTPEPVPFDGQTTGGSVIVMGDWIVGATNSVPATGPLTVFAIFGTETLQVFSSSFLS